jgi:hypothetical protein
VIALTAAPANGWRVAAWSGSDNDSSTVAGNSVTMPDHPHTINVTYSEIITPVGGAVYLPLASFDPCIRPSAEREPNDTLDQAVGPLCFNENFSGFPDNRNDYYFFDLTAQSSVTIELRDITGMDPQLQLYRDATFITSRGGAPYLIEAPLAAGRYYIRVFVAGNFNSTTSYTLSLRR